MKPKSWISSPSAIVRPAACMPERSRGNGRSSIVPLLPTTSWPGPPFVKVRLSNRWMWPEIATCRATGRLSPAAAA